MTDKYRNTAKGRIAPNGYRLCDPLPEGEILVGMEKTQWVVGKPIGCGGFGEIYLCHEKNDPTNINVVKVDTINGPLFVEVNFVKRACQPDSIRDFMAKKNLDFLGIPRFLSSGVLDSKRDPGHRFLVMERLGEELQKVLEKTRLSIRVTCRIACRIIDCLEFMHEQGYIHADIKAQNILRSTVSSANGSLSRKRKNNKRTIEDETDGNIEEDDKYVLIDYGLVERYTLQGKHKPYEFDKRKANNGTCEFRSRDAHNGIISRRSDIESLGFNIILWFYGRHPWECLLKNADHVLEKKKWAMTHIEEFLEESFSDKPLDGNDSTDSKASSSKSKTAEKVSTPRNRTIPINTKTPKGLNKFFEAIQRLAHDERPDYDKLKGILDDIGRLNSKSSHTNGIKKKANGTLSSTKKTPARGQQFKANGNGALDELSSDKESPAAAAPVVIKRTPRRLPRFSTPLIMMSPPDGGDSPLFGPFEPDSIKENQALHPNRSIHNNNNNNISLLLNSSDDDEEDDIEDRSMRNTRIYIANKRCRPREETPNSKKVPTAGKLNTKPSTSNGFKRKVNGAVSSVKKGSSKVSSKTAHSESTTPVMTAAMMKIRQKIEDAKSNKKR